MSERPSSDVAEGLDGRRAQALTPEAIEAVLADFRTWLQHAAEQAQDAARVAEPSEPIDLHTLLAQFVALRHEVHLQTKTTRAQQEQNAETLRQLGAAFEALQKS